MEFKLFICLNNLILGGKNRHFSICVPNSVTELNLQDCKSWKGPDKAVVKMLLKIKPFMINKLSDILNSLASMLLAHNCIFCFADFNLF